MGFQDPSYITMISFDLSSDMKTLTSTNIKNTGDFLLIKNQRFYKNVRQIDDSENNLADDDT